MIRGWVFACASEVAKPLDRYSFDKSLRIAEELAGLPSLKGGLWHPYRRKWATERKQLPLKDVATAGGWKDIGTLVGCYQQSDQEALLAVMSEPRRVRERVFPE